MKNPNNNPGETIKRDREALRLTRSGVLAAAAGVKLELLRGYETGTYSASTAMHRELTLTIHCIEVLLAVLKPSRLDLSDAASLRKLVLKVYRGDFAAGYARHMPEWKKTFEEMRERQEVVSDELPFLHDPMQSTRS